MIEPREIGLTHHRVVLEVRVQVGDELVLLLLEIAEVDEESRAHVLLERVHRGEIAHGLVAAYEQVAVLEQAAAPDLLG